MKDLYIPDFSEEEKNNVQKELNPHNSGACNNNLLWGSNQIAYSGNYRGKSVKRSNLSDCYYENANFDHTSFAGSILKNIEFTGASQFESVYFENCILSKVDFMLESHINNCSFYRSYIENCKFDVKEMRGNHFDDCYIDNCFFNNCTIRATMFDGATILNSKFLNCNMNNLNIEFATIKNCTLEGSSISYFQFPYIIGVFSHVTRNSNVFVSKNKIKMSMKEYFEKINNAIIYFTSLKEYFPLANIYNAINQKDIAYNCLCTGIDISIRDNNIKMVENYCRLGQYYDLLTISDIQNTLKKIDKSIEAQRMNSIYNLLIIQSHRLRARISENNIKTKFELIIETNISEKNFYEVGEFCQQLDNIIYILMNDKVKTSYRLSHNSPFEICMDCIGSTADLIAISGCLYSFISRRMSKKAKLSQEMQTYIENSNKMFLNSINNQFDAFDAAMKNTKKANQSPVIKEFRGKIIGNINEQIDKDFAFILSQ